MPNSCEYASSLSCDVRMKKKKKKTERVVSWFFEYRIIFGLYLDIWIIII